MRVADKDPEEIVDLSFDFTKDLGDELINGAVPVVVSVALQKGVDADVGLVIQGAATIVGKIVFQRVRLGVALCDYRFRCRIDSNTGRRLVLPLLLPVRTAQ
jgi:hypothetical protein